MEMLPQDNKNYNCLFDIILLSAIEIIVFILYKI